jgi:hypothetical protein
MRGRGRRHEGVAGRVEKVDLGKAVFVNYQTEVDNHYHSVAHEPAVWCHHDVAVVEDHFEMLRDVVRVQHYRVAAAHETGMQCLDHADGVVWAANLVHGPNPSHVPLPRLATLLKCVEPLAHGNDMVIAFRVGRFLPALAHVFQTDGAQRVIDGLLRDVLERPHHQLSQKHVVNGLCWSSETLFKMSNASL